MMDRMMDGMMGWGWVVMFLCIGALVALLALIVMAIRRVSRR